MLAAVKGVALITLFTQPGLSGVWRVQQYYIYSVGYKWRVDNCSAYRLGEEKRIFHITYPEMRDVFNVRNRNKIYEDIMHMSLIRVKGNQLCFSSEEDAYLCR